MANEKMHENRKRWVFNYFKVLNLLCTIDYAVTVVSLWQYLIEDVKSNNPSLFYGVIQASVPITALIFSPLFGRLHDIYGNIRSLILLNLCFAIIGNVLYSIYYSVWFVVIGRTLCGGVLIVRPLTFSETSKIYSAEDLPKKLTVLGLFTGIGVAVGPVTIEFLKLFDFNIGSFRFHYLNFIGIQMAVLFLIMFIFGCFIIKNTSNLETYSLHNESLLSRGKTSVLTKNEDETNENHTVKKLLKDLKIIAYNYDYIFIVATSVFNWANAFLFSAIMPIVIKEKLKWNHSSIIYLFTARALSSVLFFIALTSFKLKSATRFYMFLFGISCTAINMAVLLFETFIKTTTFIHVIVWLLCVITFPLSEFMEILYLPGIASQKTPHNMRSFGEGFRISMVRAGIAIAFFISGYGLDIISWYGPLLITTSFVLFCWFLYNRRNFLNVL